MIQHIVLTAFTIFGLLLSGCSLPKIIVLSDPLSAEEHLKLGSIYDVQGKTALARDQFREAVRQDPKSARAWSLLGEASYKMKEYGEAEKAYKKAIALDNKSGDLLNNLAWVYVEQGRDLEDAHSLVKRAMELTPEHRPYYLDTLGVIFLKEGKAVDAVKMLEESVRTIPPDQKELLAEAHQHLSDAYRASGDETAARDASMKRDQLLEKK